MDEKSLRELYVLKNMSQRDIAKETGVPRTTIRHWLHKYGISKSQTLVLASMKGTVFEKGSTVNVGRVRTDLRGRDWGRGSERTREKHPSWRGGIGTYRKLMPATKCSRCGTNHFEYECGRVGIEIHHVNRNRYDNRLENLEPLCVPCHRKEHLSA